MSAFESIFGPSNEGDDVTTTLDAKAQQTAVDALVNIPDASLAELTICCDLEKHVFFGEHTDAQVAEALRDSHWFELSEWTTAGPGTVSAA